MTKYPEIKEKFEKKFVSPVYGTTDYSVFWDDTDGLVGTPRQLWSFIEQSLSETEKRVREDERVMFGKKVKSFFKEGEMYIDIANRVLGYIDGLLTQPKEVQP